MYTITHREAWGSFENERDKLTEVTFIQCREALCSQFYCCCDYRASIFVCACLRMCTCTYLCVCTCVMWNNRSKESDEQTQRSRQRENKKGGRSGSVYHWPVKAVCSDLWLTVGGLQHTTTHTHMHTHWCTHTGNHSQLECQVQRLEQERRWRHWWWMLKVLLRLTTYIFPPYICFFLSLFLGALSFWCSFLSLPLPTCLVFLADDLE